MPCSGTTTTARLILFCFSLPKIIIIIILLSILSSFHPLANSDHFPWLRSRFVLVRVLSNKGEFDRKGCAIAQCFVVLCIDFGDLEQCSDHAVLRTGTFLIMGCTFLSLLAKYLLNVWWVDVVYDDDKYSYCERNVQAVFFRGRRVIFMYARASLQYSLPRSQSAKNQWNCQVSMLLNWLLCCVLRVNYWLLLLLSGSK